MVRADDSAPIWPLGDSDSEDSFRLKATGRTPAGRGMVRLQWEVKPLGTPFDGTGLEAGPILDTGSSPGGGVGLDQLVTGLAPDTLYRWRLRILTDSPFFPRSRWLWLPYNGVTESDVRTAGGPAAVVQRDLSPRRMLLGPGTPNPFHPATELQYTLPHDGHVRFRVFDLSGRQVVTLIDEVQNAGRHWARWDGRGRAGHGLPAGTYFARLEFAGSVYSRKIVLIK
jgi:hypothetical protein